MKKHLRLIALIGIIMGIFHSANPIHAQTWEPTNGPYGGSITCLANNGNILFAGTGMGIYGNGVFKSSNNGTTWSVVDGIPSLNSLASIGSTLIASTNGIYQSPNNGATWVSSNYSPQLSSPNVIITDGVTAFAGGFSGFYVSEDAGLTWTSRNNNNFPGITLPNLPDIKAMAFCGSYLYVGTGQKGIFRSADNGLTWVSVNSGLGSISSRTYGSFAVIGTDLFVGTDNQGVYRLLNNGNTWTAENSGLPTGAARRIGSLLIKDNEIYTGTNAGLYRSNNTGTISWIKSDGNLSSQQFRRLLLTGNDIFAGVANKGVYVSSDNSNTWTSANYGITGVSTRHLSHGLNSDILASTYEGVIYNSSDEGTNWITGNISADAGPCLHGTSLFVGTTGTCFRSTDYGITWNSLPEFSNVIWGAAYTFLSKGDTLFAGCGAEYGVYYSTDNGDSWNVTSGIWNLNPWGGYPGVLSLMAKGSTIYAGTVNGVFKSIDNGLNWVTCYPAMVNLPVSSLAINGDYIFAGTANYFEDPTLTPLGIYRSGDNGATWEQVNIGLGSMNIFSLTVSGTDIFAGTVSGIYKSSNNGESWVAFNEGYPSPPFAKTLLVEGNYLYSGNFLFGQPVYRRALSGSVPDQPSAITGSATPCIGSSQTYSVTNVPGVTYNWSFPAGWVITAGNSTNSVTVTVASTPGIALVTPSNGWGSGPIQFLVVTPVICSSKTLNLTSILPEGLYAGSGTLNQAHDENGVHWPAGVADHITVELHDAANYATVVYTTTDVELSTSGTATVLVPSSNSGSYYLTIKHRNSIETVSALPISFAGSTITYAFDAPEKAYGGNLLQMIDGTYVIYGGDVNLDGYIDSGDMTPLDNDSNNFVSGYVNTDVNGDGLVDSGDMTIVDNNGNAFISAVTP
ncbi:MAG: hypothetical protein RBS07_12985 [Lentimicrobium sp.]|jgi:hypothetical protein|nr:hypothetical protein [Lentimicrobium sp.]